MMAKVLFVSPSPTLQILFRQICVKAGHQFKPAFSHNGALLILDGDVFTHVISEFSARKFNGVQLLYKMRRKNANVQLALLGLDGLTEHDHTLLRVLEAESFHKPCTSRSVLHWLQQE